MIFFYNESKSNKKNLAVGRGGGGGVARVSDFFFLFSKESKSEKKICFLFEGVKVREDFLCVCECGEGGVGGGREGARVSDFFFTKNPNQIYIFFFFGGGGGGGGLE